MPGRLASTFFDLADEHGGVFTAAEAAEAGISHDALAMATRRKAIARLSRGIYRLRDYPIDENRAQLWEAVLLPTAGRRGTTDWAVISHLTALSLHFPAIDYTPAKIDVTISPAIRIRRELPAWIALHRAFVEADDIVIEFEFPVTRLARTMKDCISTSVDRRILIKALEHATKPSNASQSLTAKELEALKKMLKY